MRISGLLAFASCALFCFAIGCADPQPEIIEGPVMDNGGFSPEELSGESDQQAAEEAGDY